MALGGISAAQNWALLNPAYRYNYSNDGTDTISNQIRVMDVDTLGVDSFRYELNLVAKVCDTCAAPALFLLLNQPQFMQRKVNVGPGVWHFHDPGSFVLLPQANLGESWLFDTVASITATVTAVGPTQVFGIDVQRKAISLSDGNSIVISEPYGLLSWNEQQLIGIHGPEIGRLVPTLQEMFPYQTGDVLEYTADVGGTDGFSSNFGYSRRYKFTVNNGDPGEEAIVFEGTMIDHRWNWVSDWDGPPYSTYGHQTTLGSTWVAGEPELPWAPLLLSYPGQLVLSLRSSPWGGQDTLACIAAHGLDGNGKYVFTCSALPDPFSGSDDVGHFFPGNSNYLNQISQQPLYTEDHCAAGPAGECGALFTEGMGLNWLKGWYFEAFEEYVLAGSVLGGDTTGIVHPDDYLIALSVGDIEVGPASIFPNPASDHITVHGMSGGATITIRDLGGRMVESARISAANEAIPVNDIAPGLYVIAVDGFAPKRFMIVR